MTWRGHPRTTTRQHRERRARVLTRDGGRCYVCGGAANELDHIVPLSEGGADNDANCAAICNPCHRTKSAREGSRAALRMRGTKARPVERHPGLRD